MTRREAIAMARDALYAAGYRDRMRALARGVYESEDEALEDLERPGQVTDDDVLQSYCDDLETVRVLRESAAANEQTWPPARVSANRSLADELEASARSGLGLGKLGPA